MNEAFGKSEPDMTEVFIQATRGITKCYSTKWPIYIYIYLSLYLSIYLYIYGSTLLLLEFGHFFKLLILYTVGRTPCKGDQPVARPLPTHRKTQTQNKCIQTSIPWVGFENTIPAFERAKTVHTLDRAATVISHKVAYRGKTLMRDDCKQWNICEFLFL
jgi:hypothetical protein